jgi:hypothetical protein
MWILCPVSWRNGAISHTQLVPWVATLVILYHLLYSPSLHVGTHTLGKHRERQTDGQTDKQTDRAGWNRRVCPRRKTSTLPSQNNTVNFLSLEKKIVKIWKRNNLQMQRTFQSLSKNEHWVYRPSPPLACFFSPPKLCRLVSYLMKYHRSTWKRVGCKLMHASLSPIGWWRLESHSF